MNVPMTVPQQREPWTQQICICGRRLGQHRYGDDACPNPAWRCANGQPQWLLSTFRKARFQ